MIKCDKWIKRMAQEQRIIEPFEPAQVKNGNISYGTSSYGYDMRIADEFKVFVGNKPLDPKLSDPQNFKDVKAVDGYITIPPNSFVLARSVEYFRIPRNVVTVCFGKSTYARCGVLVNVTPFEPEWEGFVTISIANTSPVPVKLYANEGIAQVLFYEADEACETSYADKAGKYQAQKTITHGKV